MSLWLVWQPSFYSSEVCASCLSFQESLTLNMNSVGLESYWGINTVSMVTW